MEKQIKDLAVIDKQELQKRIYELNKEIIYHEDSLYADMCGEAKQELQKLQQSLIPLKGILEKAYNAGYDYDLSFELTGNGLQDFLTKPIKL